MLDYEPIASRLILSEPAETTKLAVANAEHAVDCSLHYVQFDDFAQAAVYAGKALTHLRDAHSATLALEEHPQLNPADRYDIGGAARDLVTAQVILAEVVSTVRAAMNDRGSHDAAVVDHLRTMLSRARELTCAGFQHLDEVPVTFHR